MCGTHKNALPAFAGGITYSRIDVAGQRIIRSLIRRDSLFCQYMTGRFHLSLYSLCFRGKDKNKFVYLRSFEKNNSLI